MSRAITESSLDAFATWMTERNRGATTVRDYCSQLKHCAAAKSLTTRLRATDLSPNTRWQIKAALKAWAKFTKDADLTEILDDIRLPPPRRVTKKVSLKSKEWKALISHVRQAQMHDVHRVIIVIMALRGLRLGDVLRIENAEVRSALDTGTLSAVAKGEKRRVFSAAPIMDDLKILAKIPAWRSVRDLVGPPEATERAIGNRIRRTLSRHALKVGISHCYPHQLRRTFATMYLESMRGDPQALIKLQKYMDWSDLSTAARYVDDVDVQELNAAADRMVEGM